MQLYCGEDVDDVEDADDAGVGVDDVAPAPDGVCGDEGAPGAAGDGVVAAIARLRISR